MLNKLRCHAHFQFSANQITWSRLLIQIHILYDKQCRSRSVGFFGCQLIWIYTATLFPKQGISRFNRTRVKAVTVFVLLMHSMLGENFSRHFEIFSYFSRELARLWHFIPLETVCMKCQCLFLGKISKISSLFFFCRICPRSFLGKIKMSSFFCLQNLPQEW